MASQVEKDSEDLINEIRPVDVSVTVQPEEGGAMVAGRDDEPASHHYPYIGSSSSCRISNMVNWKRRLRTTILFAATNSVFWFVALSSYRAYCLLALSLTWMVTLLTVKDVALSRSKGLHLWLSMTGSWEIDSGQDSRSETGPQLTDSWMSFKLFLQETSSFKQQNPGKFCLLVCSLCTFLAMLGRYIPGVIISYISVLGIFLWPLMSLRDFGLWLGPVLQKLGPALQKLGPALQKLDFGVGEFLQKIKQNHEKRRLQAEAALSIEADLSSLTPKLDSTVFKEMSISDTEVSDVTWTDNGTFNLSEGHTPQTENSEDLDREEVFIGGLPEFPSLDNGMGTNGEDDDDLSIGLPTPPLHSVRSKGVLPTHTEQADDATQALDLVNKMASDLLVAAVTSAIQEKIEAAIGMTTAERPRLSKPESLKRRPLDLGTDSDSEVEDFELLDQSELEQLEGELGLSETSRAEEEAQLKPGKPSSSGAFFSKLLGRQ